MSQKEKDPWHACREQSQDSCKTELQTKLFQCAKNGQRKPGDCQGTAVYVPCANKKSLTEEERTRTKATPHSVAVWSIGVAFVATFLAFSIFSPLSLVAFCSISFSAIDLTVSTEPAFPVHCEGSFCTTLCTQPTTGRHTHTCTLLRCLFREFCVVNAASCVDPVWAGLAAPGLHTCHTHVCIFFLCLRVTFTTRKGRRLTQEQTTHISCDQKRRDGRRRQRRFPARRRGSGGCPHFVVRST